MDLELIAMASSLLLAVVFVFDLIAFALAVAAEQRRSTVSPMLSQLFLSFFLVVISTLYSKTYNLSGFVRD